MVFLCLEPQEGPTPTAQRVNLSQQRAKRSAALVFSKWQIFGQAEHLDVSINPPAALGVKPQPKGVGLRVS